MNTQTYHASTLEKLFQNKPVCVLKDLQLALDTQSNMTVRRKLSELPYLISYSDHSK